MSLIRWHRRVCLLRIQNCRLDINSADSTSSRGVRSWSIASAAEIVSGLLISSAALNGSDISTDELDSMASSECVCSGSRIVASIFNSTDSTSSRGARLWSIASAAEIVSALLISSVALHGSDISTEELDSMASLVCVSSGSRIVASIFNSADSTTSRGVRMLLSS